MKKVYFFTILLLLAVSSFAQEEIPNKYIFIEGTADNRAQVDFFMTNFAMEAVGAGYTVTGSREEAAHTLRFNVSPNTAVVDGEQRQEPPDSNRYVARISLIRNKDDVEAIAFDFFFTDLEEVYPYNRELFQNAAFFIPPITEEDLIQAREPDNRWKNKWIYVRASFDYPITFYILQGEGLYQGVSLYLGTYENPTYFDPQDHKIMAMPGATLGFEFQFLNFMSLEVNYQVSMGDTRDNMFINMAAGAELKFPIKFKNVVLSPYGAFMYPLSVSPIFSDFPLFEVGAGIQLSARGGSSGAFFVDLKYMFSFSDTLMRNPYLGFPNDKQYSPNPAVIHYKRSFIGIGIGYKFGFLDR